MRPRSALFGYQEAGAALMARKRQLGVFVRCGLGKTPMTLTALHDIGRPRTLVLAPASVVDDDVWGREARSWEHLRGLRVQAVDGSPSARAKKLTQASDIDVISYENFLWLSDTVDLAERYAAITFDELSRIKAVGTRRFKRLRSRLGGSEIGIRYGLTGTPVGNHLLDLFGEMFAVCGEAPLGPRFCDFQTRYFHAFDPQQRKWEINHGAEVDIIERIKPYSFSLDAKLAAGRIPELRVNEINVTLPPHVMKMERDLAKKAVATLESGTELEAFSASQLAIRLRQIASGAVYTDPLDDSKWEKIHDAKTERLAEIVEQAQGEPILVFYWFRHELERLCARFPHAEVAGNRASHDRWNARKLKVMFAHPASAGHGLNLQHGGSTICWFTLPYSWELWSQANARLARTGQSSPIVTVHCFLAGCCDWAVLNLLRKKERTESQVLKHVELITKDDPVFA